MFINLKIIQINWLIQKQQIKIKLGCEINKSLTTLGRVISILAERSLGKTKEIVPYTEKNV